MIPLNSSDMSVYVVPPGVILGEEEIAGGFRVDGTGKEGKRRTVVGTMEIGLFRRSGNAEKVLRKPEVVL